MRGIILAGGEGTRMMPATKIINKHLLPVLNNPMIIYPLKTLINLKITDILIVSGGNHLGGIINFLGSGSDYGVKLTYKVQSEAGGIAQALSLAKDFSNGEKIAVILGDNFFNEEIKISNISKPTIFLRQVSDPERFGVYDFKTKRIIEKPKKNIGNWAVTGLYFYDSEVFDFIETLKPSKRGELEITSVNNWYLKRNRMEIQKLKEFWSDMGTPQSLLNTAKHILKCKRISENNLGKTAWNKDKKWGEDIRKKISVANTGRKYSNEINSKKGHSKEKNPNWKGGISTEEKIIRTSREYEEWRKKVFERDNYTCLQCGQIGGTLHSDHIKSFSLFPELRFSVENGRTLCKKCHEKTDTYGSKSWKPKDLK